VDGARLARASRAVIYHYLALAGVGAKVVTATQPSATGNQAITGVGFQPRAVIALSAQEATGDDAASTPNTSRNLRRVLGVADAASSKLASGRPRRTRSSTMPTPTRASTTS
jgi:hypothetical protein